MDYFKILTQLWITRKIQTQGKFSSVQSFSHVQLFVTPWTAVLQASQSITNSQSLLKHMSIVSVMPSSHLILCRPLLLPPSIFPRIRVFSNESVLHNRWPKYWSFSFSISPSNLALGSASPRRSSSIIHDPALTLGYPGAFEKGGVPT